MALPLAALEETISFKVSGGNHSASDAAIVKILVNSQGRDTTITSALAEGIQVSPGFRGEPAIQMREAEYSSGAHTDLLLHFNNAIQQEVGAFYSILRNNSMLNSQVRRMGPAAAMFNNDSSGLILQTLPGSMFAPGTFWNDFSIEFWLYPTTLNEGEQILNWQGSTWLDGKQRPQSIQISLKDHRLNMDFTNVFVRVTAGKTKADQGRNILETSRFSLRNRREILPRVWQHHMIRFDSRSSLLEYLIDGKIEDAAYATVSGHEGGEPFRPYLGETSEPRLSIGTHLTGFLDELRISTRRVAAMQTDSFDNRGSYVIFNPIDFREIGIGSKVMQVNAQYSHPGSSDIAFYYKMTTMPGLAMRDDPAWVRFIPGRIISNRNQGQYLYFKVELLPDGSGNQGPSLQELSITYRPDPPPPPPGGVMAIPQDGAILLRWNPVPVNDIQGYLVYYGTRPGQYFGEGASIGKSPHDVGLAEVKDGAIEVKISGLENGRLYYFVVASYDVSNNPIYGIHLKRSLSKEVSARPAQ